MALTTVLSLYTLLYSLLAICHAQQTCLVWTQWIDDENGGPLNASSIGEFELINDLRGPYGFCDEPTDIECALADDTNTPYNETGQDHLTCNLQQGFLCFHSQQSGDCFNYAIRLLCAEPLKEDSKNLCVENDGISFEFSCTFLDGWTDDLDDKSSCQYNNAIVDVSDAIYGILDDSSVADELDCVERPLLSKADDSDMVVEITVRFSKGTELTKDEMVDAFKDAASKRNLDASFKYRVDINGTITAERIQSGSERQRGSLHGILATLITVMALFYM
ncbi:uncharacterized protein [Ptychodera flava]|uniref:uncharacterized protein n=1 Tax=Ptychodera flava TaxID=63121 RepID=UPI00396A7131